VKFPKRVKHRSKELATIYGKSKNYQFYRVTWLVAGKRQMKSFQRYGGEDGALAFAEKLVPDLYQGSQVTALSPNQARDALAALEHLHGFYQTTGHRVSLLAGISEYCEAASKLNGRTLGEAVDGYLSSVATVKRKDLSEAVEEFIQADEPRTRSADGHRAQLSAKYAYNRAIILRRFAETFKNTAVSDLGKEHIDTFMGSLEEFSAKSRNHHRGAIRQFLGWCVRKDFLSPGYRLGEADGMRPELSNTAEIEFYTPKEFRALLEAVEGPMQAMIAIGGLAGLRTAELLRLDWADVWHVSGHIEVTAGKSKTRQRRLVEVGPALSAWLSQFRSGTSGKVCPITAASAEILWQQQFLELCEKGGVKRKKNGLRHAFCSYAYVLHGENWAAQAAGHAPALLHANYRGLATKAEAEKWFDVAPAKADNVIPMAAAQKTGA
jgi:integrase